MVEQQAWSSLPLTEEEWVDPFAASRGKQKKSAETADDQVQAIDLDPFFLHALVNDAPMGSSSRSKSGASACGDPAAGTGLRDPQACGTP
ncbi:hypothetical protein [Pseudoroseicyclus tamaricis]|uniref:Uncharacterized protein n=1 Tax=Pseudoroseicyclus tamaricis TaxID=2705421 RepID=A0A6B2JPK5_9RHOB|nr:hypothetical protein [Pseudoroseicyclus tamaricis]NDU99884.1 hypothetical protein [Pseudoroseicyclus tamaricis]